MTDPRTSILKAVQQALKNSPDVQAELTGGVWTGEIPESARMPYGSLEVDSSDTELCSRPPDLERTRFSIVLFALSATQVDALLDRLQSFLTDRADYQFTNGDTLSFFYPARRTTRSEFTRDKAGNQVFTGVVMFEAGVFRN